MASRLDRFLVTESIVSQVGEIRENVIPAGGFDHWPVCLSWEGATDQLLKPFHFEQFCLEHKDFKGLVEQWCQDMDNPGGTMMYKFNRSLKF